MRMDMYMMINKPFRLEQQNRFMLTIVCTYMYMSIFNFIIRPTLRSIQYYALQPCLQKSIFFSRHLFGFVRVLMKNIIYEFRSIPANAPYGLLRLHCR